MSRIKWSKDARFKNVVLKPEPDERMCECCGHFTYVCDHQERYLKSLGDPLYVVSKVTCCP